MTTKEHLDQCERVLREAEQAFHTLKYERSTKESAEREKAINEIRAKYDAIYNERISALAETMRLATAAHDAAKLAHAEAEPDLPKGWKLGMRVVEWDYPNSGWGQRKMKPTGKVGTVALIRPDSVHPENLSDRADVGDVIVRILKKNGEPSAKYAKGWYLSHWHPEGVDPNRKEGK